MTDLGSRPVETPGEWLRFAEENLGVARREMTYERPAYHTVCFLHHSAAEKYLKAYLISRGWTLKKTHDLLELLDLCEEYDPAFDSLVGDGSILNEYSVTGRYPGDISFDAFSEDNAREAVRAADERLNFASSRSRSLARSSSSALTNPEPLNLPRNL
ncbi:MAG: HEPN domain-containing protein [Chloroflexi bacterium]|nr:HEPN domain-containing protein [Chloroflexota bacterium]